MAVNICQSWSWLFVSETRVQTEGWELDGPHFVLYWIVIVSPKHVTFGDGSYIVALFRRLNFICRHDVYCAPGIHPWCTSPPLCTTIMEWMDVTRFLFSFIHIRLLDIGGQEHTAHWKFTFLVSIVNSHTSQPGMKIM